ncbi:MAG: ATP synthase F1 subunit gamma [Bacteroidota bacterium]
MANLKEVKGRIQSVNSTQQITKAMKMVAAAKLRRAQDRIIQMRPYSQKLTEIIRNVSAAESSEESENPFSTVRPVKKVLLVVISSDRGLCGAFNSSIFKEVKNLIDEKFSEVHEKGDLQLLTIGKKATEHFTKRKYQVISDYSTLIEKLSFESSRDAAEMVMKGFLEQQFDHIEIVFNEFKNVATQIIRKEQFLPLTQSVAEDDDAGAAKDYIYEPSRSFIFEDLLPKSLKIQFYKVLLESNASEHGARMTAMDKATDNADELLKELKLTYNRTRQAAITKEILEIVGGAEALAQG